MLATTTPPTIPSTKTCSKATPLTIPWLPEGDDGSSLLTPGFSVPVVDLSPYLNDPTSPQALDACKQVAQSLLAFSALAIRDPRVKTNSTHSSTSINTFQEEDMDENDEFLDMMEEYFAQPDLVKRQDCRPEVGYQVGATPERTEVPRCASSAQNHACLELLNQLSPENKPHDFHHADPKWRFFWRMEDGTSTTTETVNNNKGTASSNEATEAFTTQLQLCKPVIPPAFKDVWSDKMNRWGRRLYDAVYLVAEMAAVGFGMDKDTLTTRTHGGHHLLAPTGSDLSRYGDVGTTLAGFHNDLGFLTIHGKSRYPGLYIWPAAGGATDPSVTTASKSTSTMLATRDKILVTIPDGCLLVQAAQQMEYVTGGHVKAGFHEVAVVPETRAAMARRQQQQQEPRPQWRVSSTLFFHFAPQAILEPLGPFRDLPRAQATTTPVMTSETGGPLTAAEQVRRELEVIQLL